MNYIMANITATENDCAVLCEPTQLEFLLLLVLMYSNKFKQNFLKMNNSKGFYYIMSLLLVNKPSVSGSFNFVSCCGRLCRSRLLILMSR